MHRARLSNGERTNSSVGRVAGVQRNFRFGVWIHFLFGATSGGMVGAPNL